MLRDKNLIPLSHQHQHVLALCVRLDRALQAGSIDVKAWQDEIQQIFEQEVRFHFAAEEKELFPAAEKFSEMKPLVDELLAEHATLRSLFARAGDLQETDFGALIESLAQHVRKEERQLFEGLQQVMSPAQLAEIGAGLQQALQEATKTCAIPNPATRLRAKS
jgi:hemerythrin-like domain-containing protein